jgi:glycine cleavage system aminomethyltransferase T
MTARSPQPRSPLETALQALGARTAECGGWRVALSFGDPEAERAAASEGVAVAERIGLHVLQVEGSDLDDLAAEVGAGDVQPGRACEVRLGEIPARWLWLTRDQARVVVASSERWGPAGTGTPSNLEDLVRGGGAVEVSGDLQVSVALPQSASLDGVPVPAGPPGTDPQRPPRCVHVTDISSGLTTLALIGPKAPDVLARLVRIDVAPPAFADRSLALAASVGIPLQVVRWDLGGQLSYELTVGRDLAAYFWGALFHAGEDLGLRPIGADALASLEVGTEP